jgi:hypothetical protein
MNPNQAGERSHDRDTDTFFEYVVNSFLEQGQAINRLEKAGAVQAATCQTLDHVLDLPATLERVTGKDEIIVILNMDPRYRDIDIVEDVILDVLDDVLFKLWEFGGKLHLIRPPYRSETQAEV